MAENTRKQFGQLAAVWGKRLLPLEILKSPAGFYLGTLDTDGSPYSRESIEYWPTRAGAARAMTTGGWTQKPEP